jgi:predicted aldo/keto reductase-like oxidoreductase
MQYRKLGRTGLDVSAIALGTEYLINQPRQAVTGVIHAAIDQGVNYFDTFWAQPAFRDMIGAAFKGYREKILTVAHLGAIWENDQGGVSRDPQVCAQFFLDFLKRTGMEYVDVIFLHNCDRPEDYDALMRPGGILDLAHRYQKEGKARFIGFSGHNAAIARQAVESNAVDVLMYPVNLASHAVPGNPELLNACVVHNVAVVAMKVYGGGSLLRDKRTIQVEDYQMGRTQMAGAPMHFEKTVTITPLHCLAYVLSQPGVSTLVPGCKDLDELAAAQAYWMAAAEDKDFSAILPAFAQFKYGECVYCNHCLPCPAQIDIGATISLFEQGRQNLTAELRSTYRSLGASAADCIQCGDCVARCPFGVDVIAKMDQAAALFAG